MPEVADPEPRPATPRFDTIDLLRGLSIVSVVLLHTWLRMHFAGFHLHFPPSPWALFVLLRNGGNGVTLFFAISGFLITLTSLRRFGSLANMRPGVFYRIRFARIAPLLLSLLAVLSVLHLTHVDGFRIKGATLPRALLSALTFHLNWLEAVHMHAYLPANWDVLWSLSVEEMFYLFFPLIALAAFRLRCGPIPFIAMLSVFVVLGPLARTILTTNDQWRDTSYLAGMDAIALGCLTALLTQRLSQSTPLASRTLLALQFLGVAMMSLFMLFLPWHWLRPLYHAGPRRNHPRLRSLPRHARLRPARPPRPSLDRAAALVRPPLLRGLPHPRVPRHRRNRGLHKDPPRPPRPLVPRHPVAYCSAGSLRGPFPLRAAQPQAPRSPS